MNVYRGICCTVIVNVVDFFSRLIRTIVLIIVCVCVCCVCVCVCKCVCACVCVCVCVCVCCEKNHNVGAR